MYVHENRIPSVIGYIEDCPAVLESNEGKEHTYESLVDKTELISEMVYCLLDHSIDKDFLNVLRKYILINDKRLKAMKVFTVVDPLTSVMHRANTISAIRRMLDGDKRLLPEIMLIALCTVDHTEPIEVPPEFKVKLKDFVTKTRLSPNYKNHYNYRLDSHGAFEFMQRMMDFAFEHCLTDGSLEEQPWQIFDVIFLLVGYRYAEKAKAFEGTGLEGRIDIHDFLIK